ncbi:FAD-dependent oxidoreductase domain-containing protein 2-like [Ptychodera flava]|uniref:FAD-dependent oxidoreductase domain-containing protein 2-like n=1 Tax=Ptychodera flava TaxID=63121 RepID=UPI003969C80F
MWLQLSLVLFFPMQLFSQSSEEMDPALSKEYCVIGAGPAGLQMGYFLQRAGRDYVIFERDNTAGAFFVQYPRHRKLISINKRYTGKNNKEFNLRHDWNSLISDDESLQIKHYSKEFFPHADVMVKYLQDYASKLKLNVQYNTNIANIEKKPDLRDPNSKFYLTDQVNKTYVCQTLIVSTGIASPNKPTFRGMDHVVGYEDMSLDPEDYEGKTVLILGRGNSAFETADHIMPYTNFIHMVARTRVRLSWETHYVGDLRAVNNGLLDTYQLKSLDGIMEAPVEEMKLVKKDNKFWVDIFEVYSDNGNETNVGSEPIDNFAAREPYDVVIRCLGFKFDFSIFDEKLQVTPSSRKTNRKYPIISHNYESPTTPGLFFAGTNTHSLDFRQSAGGFIHGFRYTTRALHRLLEQRNHRVPWPSVTQSITHLLDHIIKRINEASGIYQMFGVLGDVIILNKDKTSYTYLEEFPIKLLDGLPKVAGIPAKQVIVIVMEYGKNFSGPGKDIFRGDRAIGEPMEAHNSNFLHPVFYYYEQLPTRQEMMNLGKRFDILPRPTRMHHIVEDFLTLWTAPNSHLLPLRRFLENVINQDLRHFYDEECFVISMTSKEKPLSCQFEGHKTASIPGMRMATLNHEFKGMLDF